MGRLTPKLTQSAYKVTTTRNEYGDINFNSTASDATACLYRDISYITRGNQNKEEILIDGYLWFDGTITLSKGDIYQLNGEYFRIERITKGKDLLRTNQVDFYKCEVTKQRQIS